MALVGTLLVSTSVSLGGCAAIPLGQLAYQAATAPAKPCTAAVGTAGCGQSGVAAMWDGLKGELAAR